MSLEPHPGTVAAGTQNLPSTQASQNVSRFVTKTTTSIPSTHTSPATLSHVATSIVHASPATISRDILQHLPELCTVFAESLSPLTATATVHDITHHAFTHPVTTAYTSSYLPIVTPISFNLMLEASTLCEATTITFTTNADHAPAETTSPADAASSASSASVRSRRSSATSRSPVTSAEIAAVVPSGGVTLFTRPGVRSNVVGAITITPHPYQTSSVTATFESAIEDVVAEPPSAASGMEGMTMLEKLKEGSMRAPTSVLKPRTTDVRNTTAEPAASPALAPDLAPDLAPAAPALSEKLTVATRSDADNARREEKEKAAPVEASEFTEDKSSSFLANPYNHTGTGAGKKTGVRQPSARAARQTMSRVPSMMKTMTASMAAQLLLPKTFRHSTSTLLPSATTAKILDHLLNLIPTLHTKYARYGEVDAAMYAHFSSTIPNSPPIQPHESTLIDTSLTYDDQAQQLERQAVFHRKNMGGFIEGWKRIPNTVASPVAYFQKFDSDSSTWGKAVGTVDASHTHVFSYIWNQHSYEHVNSNVEKEGPDALNKVVFQPDSHSMLNAFVVNFGLAISPRVFSTWLVWRQEPDKSFTIAVAPITNYKLLNNSTAEIMRALDDNAAAADAIRGTVKGFWRFKSLAPEGKPAAERTRELLARLTGSK